MTPRPRPTVPVRPVPPARQPKKPIDGATLEDFLRVIREAVADDWAARPLLPQDVDHIKKQKVQYIYCLIRSHCLDAHARLAMPSFVSDALLAKWKREKDFSYALDFVSRLCEEWAEKQLLLSMQNKKYDAIKFYFERRQAAKSTDSPAGVVINVQSAFSEIIPK